MAMVKEVLNGGVVTARDATLLLETEVQQADDCVLRPNDLAIHRAPGRTVYGTVLASFAVSSDTVNASTMLATSSGSYADAFNGQTLSGSGIQANTTVSAVLARTQRTITGCTISGTTLVTLPATAFPGTATMVIGQRVRASGGTGSIPANATIATITGPLTFTISAAGTNGSPTSVILDPTITMSLAATASATVSITFGAGTAVKGLRFLGFDDQTDLLVAFLGQSIYYSAYTGATGTFTNVLTGFTNAGTETLDAVSYKSAHYLMMGDRPQRIGYTKKTTGGVPTVTGRPMGMMPVPDTAGFTTPFSAATTSGTWSSLLGTGVYWFMVTEVFNAGLPDEVESTYVLYDDKARPLMKSVSITDITTQAILVTAHQPFVNNGDDGTNQLTHWRVYMSERQPDTSVVPPPSSFVMVAELDRTTLSVTLKATNTIFGPFTASASVDGGGTLSGVATAWVNRAAMQGTANGAMAYTQFDDAGAILRTFGAGATTGTVTGIEVAVYGRWKSDGNSSPAGAWVSICGSNGSSELTTRREFRTVNEHADIQNGSGFGGILGVNVFKSGGQFDTWGRTWTDTDFDDGTLALGVGKISTAHNDTMYIDSVSITIYIGGKINDLTTTRNFPSIVLESDVGITAVTGANFPPPRATTGDIFDGQLVMNDITNLSMIRYSVPDKPEYFPQPYFLDFASKKLDVVTNIKTVGNVLVVGMVSSLKRVNYLPREDDASFDRGRAWEHITVENGIVGNQAAAVFDMGSGPLLAYVAYNGLYVTDGVRSRPLNEDLDWANTVSEANLSKCVLVNYPKMYSLVLYYTPTGGSANTKALWFNYHRSHTKGNGTLPAMGPVSVSGRSAINAELSGVPKLHTGHATDGKVYLEDNGTSSADTGSTIAPVIRTRLQYIADIGSKTRPQRVYARVAATGTTSTATGTTTINSTAVTSAAAFGSVTVGMGVTGSNIQPGTTVSAVTDASNITLSAAATASGSGTLTFSTGAAAVTMRRQNIGEAITDLESLPFDTVVGGLVRIHLDHQAEAHELKITKAATVDAAFRLHYIGYDVVPHGREQGTL